jgi:hypothetical protein
MTAGSGTERQAESSCRRQPRVKTVGVCADELSAAVPLDTVRGRLCAQTGTG